MRPRARARGRVEPSESMPSMKNEWFQALMRAMRTGLCVEDAWTRQSQKRVGTRPRKGWPGRPHNLYDYYDDIISKYHPFLQSEWGQRRVWERIVVVLWQRWARRLVQRGPNLWEKFQRSCYFNVVP